MVILAINKVSIANMIALWFFSSFFFYFMKAIFSKTYFIKKKSNQLLLWVLLCHMYIYVYMSDECLCGYVRYIYVVMPYVYVRCYIRCIFMLLCQMYIYVVMSDVYLCCYVRCIFLSHVYSCCYAGCREMDDTRARPRHGTLHCHHRILFSEEEKNSAKAPSLPFVWPPPTTLSNTGRRTITPNKGLRVKWKNTTHNSVRLYYCMAHGLVDW